MPILGALVLQAAYGAVDLLVVGRFGTTSGLSAVSTGSQVLNLVTFVITQFAMGITVLIARYIGEKKPQYIGALIGGATIIFAIVSAVLFVIMIGFSQPIAVLMQALEEAVELTSTYVRILRIICSQLFSEVLETANPHYYLLRLPVWLILQEI